MKNSSKTIPNLKTQHKQKKDMTEEDKEMVDLHTEVSKEKFEEIKEFIDDHKDTRKRSKKFYGQKILDLAILRARQFEEDSGDVLEALKE